jgi:hypothetical protein
MVYYCIVKPVLDDLSTLKSGVFLYSAFYGKISPAKEYSYYFHNKIFRMKLDVSSLPRLLQGIYEFHNIDRFPTYSSDKPPL